MKNKKQEILQIASEQFLQSGYLAATLRDIASRCGLEVSSIYSHFSSKEAILREICFENAKAFLEGITLIDRKLSVKDQMNKIVELHFAILNERQGAVLLLGDEWRHLTGKNLSDFKQMRKQYESEISERLGKNYSTAEEKDVVMRYFLSGMIWIYKRKDLWNEDQKTKIKNLLFKLFSEGIA